MWQWDSFFWKATSVVNLQTKTLVISTVLATLCCKSKSKILSGSERTSGVKTSRPLRPAICFKMFETRNILPVGIGVFNTPNTVLASFTFDPFVREYSRQQRTRSRDDDRSNMTLWCICRYTYYISMCDRVQVRLHLQWGTLPCTRAVGKL